MNIYESIRFHLKYFGVKQTFNLVLYPRIADKIRSSNNQRYINNLLKFQRSIIKDVIEKYRNVPLVTPPHTLVNYKIWTCWWQGKEQMPEVIRLCHESLLRNANGHEVILITKDNYRQYVKLPDYIYKKVASGNISFSHFSDMIRLSLLCQYGGRWVDSALFVLHPLDFEGNFHMAKLDKLNDSLCQGRWWFGDLGGISSHKVFHYMLDCLLEYWKRYDAVVNYLMFDGFLRIAYEELVDVQECIDTLPVSSPDVHVPRYTAHNKYEEQRFKKLSERNDVLSLTWRINYPVYTTENELTFYGKLMEISDNAI